MLLIDEQVADDFPIQHLDLVRKSATGHSPALCGAALIVADGAAILLAAVVSTYFLSYVATSYQGWTIDLADFAMLSVGLGICLAVKGRYSERIPFWTEARLVICASLTVLAIAVGLGIVSKQITSLSPLLLAFIVFPPPAIGANRLVKFWLSRIGKWEIPVVIIGGCQAIDAAETILQSDPSLGFCIVARLDPDIVLSGSGVPRLNAILTAHRAKCLFIATDMGEAPGRHLMECALREQVRFAVFLQPYPASTFSAKPTCFFSHDATLLSYQNRLSQPLPRLAKSTMDIVVALILLIVVLPVFVLLSILIMMDGGPVLFRQLRIGAGGKPFYCLKFRTMVVHADRVLQEALARDPALAAEWQERRKLAKDPRVTRLGRILRQTSLDELPQLINVLRFDMSLVGPRPIVESEVSLYGDNIAQYYATRPGITGVWQVSGRSTTSYTRRVQLDAWYVNNWTFWQDIQVLMKTIPVVFGRKGAF